jgi:hypothetical protein
MIRKYTSRNAVFVPICRSSIIRWRGIDLSFSLSVGAYLKLIKLIGNGVRFVPADFRFAFLLPAIERSILVT